MHRLRPRSIARQINRKRTLPQRLCRELRWVWRDLRDLHAELTRWSDERVAGKPRQSEMNDPRERADGVW